MKKGFTLVEILIVVLIFTFLFGAILTVLTSSNRSWRTGQNKLIEQQEARRAMDNIAKLVRQSSPDWVQKNNDGTIKAHYPVTITSDSKRIDFYKAFFYPSCCPDKCGDPAGSDNSVCDDSEGNRHNAGDIMVSKITFKLGPEVGPQCPSLFQLLKKEGIADSLSVGHCIEDINFAWSDTCDATCFSSINCGIADCSTSCNVCCSCYRRDSFGLCACATGIQVRINTKKENGFTLNSKITLRNHHDLPDDVEVSQPGTGEF